MLPPNWLVEPLLLVTVRPAALDLLDEALAICRPTITYASKRLREAVKAVRGCRARGAGSEAGSEARYLLRWHFFALHRQYDAILQSDLDLEVLHLP